MFGSEDEPFPDALKELLGTGLTDLVVTSAGAATDAALLLLAHSILDDCAISYCRVCALAKPDDWDGFIEKRNVEFQSVKANTIEAIRKELIDSRLKALEKESLPEKIEMLHRLCKPPQNYAPLRDYSYDRETLKRIDLDRHKVVHYSGFTNAAPNLQEDLEFMGKTAWYLMGLVNQSYGLKIDLRHFFGLQTATSQEVPPPAE